MGPSRRLLEKTELVRGEDDPQDQPPPPQPAWPRSPCSAPHSKRVWHPWNAAYQLTGICHLNGRTYPQRPKLYLVVRILKTYVRRTVAKSEYYPRHVCLSVRMYQCGSHRTQHSVLSERGEDGARNSNWPSVSLLTLRLRFGCFHILHTQPYHHCSRVKSLNCPAQ
jgi:hypothetical protein